MERKGNEVENYDNNNNDNDDAYDYECKIIPRKINKVNNKDNNNDDDFDYIWKIILLGDSGVGKTNILSRFSHNKFDIDSKTTIGVESAKRDISVNGEIVRSQIWDIAGIERGRPITSAYYKGAVGVLIVFDITRKVTFENVEKWLKEMRMYTDQTIVVMLIGNKADLAHLRVVSIKEATDFAKRENITYMETSAARDKLHIDEVFKDLACKIYRVINRHELDEANEPETPPVKQMSDDGGKDDNERFTEKNANMDLVAKTTDDPQLCKDCGKALKKSDVCGFGDIKEPCYNMTREVGSSNTGESYAPHLCQELSDLKEKLEAVQAQNAEMLAREMTREAELKSLRMSVEGLPSAMEKLMAQQPTKATRPAPPHDHEKVVF